ncbi:MAG: arginine--tRNA ligase [Chloroflexota bacterium]|nr:arginine--tRNA ligase [Chloroflexota bacterium]
MSTTKTISKIIAKALKNAHQSKELPEINLHEIIVEKPRNKNHGNWSSNIAMVLSKEIKKNPLDIAKIITKNIEENSSIENVEVLAPGFLNFKLSEKFRSDLLNEILVKKSRYGANNVGKNKKVQLEFVSVNPTGPVHVGHARGAIVGSCIANILDFSGYKIVKEYYVNDAGNQIDLYVESIKSKIYQYFGEKYPIPEDGYLGENIKSIAEKIISKLEINKNNLKSIKDEEIKEISIKLTLKKIKSDLSDLGILYDNWFFESDLFKNQTITNIETILDKKNLIFEKDGAEWFKSSNFFTENDVVIRRSKNEGHTYFFSDMAYHYDKFIVRDFDVVINIFGADHHSHVDRLKSAVKAFDIDIKRLKILLTQIVHFKNENKIQKFSKRSGNIYTVSDLVNLVGKDVCRFNFLNRSLDSQQEFDLELATQESSENPVYYVQYAYARLCSIINSFEQKIERKDSDLSLLETEYEKNLIDSLDFFPQVIIEATEKLQTHNITQYSIELAKELQKFYEKCRVISDDLELSKARIILISACKIVLKNTLDIMGVETPERM